VQRVSGHISGDDHSYPLILPGCHPVADALQSQGGADTGRLELHSGAALEGTGAINPLQHADDIRPHCFGLVDCRLSAQIDLAYIAGLEVAAAHQLQKRHGSHGSGILMGIGNGHPLNPDPSRELFRINIPLAGELSS